MSKNIICLSGWGQKFDSLECIFQDQRFDPFFVQSLNYSKFDDCDKFFADVSSKNLDADIVVGWSLGGQLAIRLIEQQILKPKTLILIAPPFQMVKDENITAAMTQKTFVQFRQNFADAPDKTLKQFSILTAMNDKNASQIARTLDVSNDNFDNLLSWLDELKRFNCFNTDFNKMPRTIFLQGAGDMIVHASQAGYFQERISDFTLETFKNCGHAPHINDIDRVRKIIFF